MIVICNSPDSSKTGVMFSMVLIVPNNRDIIVLGHLFYKVSISNRMMLRNYYISIIETSMGGIWVEIVIDPGLGVLLKRDGPHPERLYES